MTAESQILLSEGNFFKIDRIMSHIIPNVGVKFSSFENNYFLLSPQWLLRGFWFSLMGEWAWSDLARRMRKNWGATRPGRGVLSIPIEKRNKKWFGNKVTSGGEWVNYQWVRRSGGYEGKIKLFIRVSQRIHVQRIKESLRVKLQNWW